MLLCLNKDSEVKNRREVCSLLAWRPYSSCSGNTSLHIANKKYYPSASQLRLLQPAPSASAGPPHCTVYTRQDEMTIPDTEGSQRAAIPYNREGLRDAGRTWRSGLLWYVKYAPQCLVTKQCEPIEQIKDPNRSTHSFCCLVSNQDTKNGS